VVNLTLLSRPLFHMAGRDISTLGLIGFVGWFVAGLIAIRVLQSGFVRRILRRFRIDSNLIAIATTILSLVALIFFTVSAINAAGIPFSWSKGLPGINLSLVQIFMLVVLLIVVFWLAARTKRLLFDRFLKDTGLDRSLQ
jgi:small-conductance mechanosensitive channel